MSRANFPVAQLFGEEYVEAPEVATALDTCLGCAFHRDQDRCMDTPDCQDIVYVLNTDKAWTNYLAETTAARLEG